MSLTRGRRLGVDVGSVRIGVAVSDPDGILATPVETVAGADVDAAVARLRALVEEYEAVEVIVGLPKTLRNTDGPAAEKARAFGARLAEELEGISVVFSDERLTTVAAQQALHASGRSVKASRGVIDQAAAVAILQGWLDSRR
ncbi:Holliday junction resolvase RuvX [Gordonia sp. w5E2]|uniref:Putative pre-16S rRNA nuclease n=1 Tax=Gordonia jacobaea TaxID=122202 RepID=A0ABR5IHG5_9ACTN|nr:MULTISPECIES: Holliday junction resolvase RuvX [Gordonia]KNA93167.1 Holliday junction resolvase [Gordonia jacobaea]OBC03666.1 Holliday junction DNA helicase RuvA [Gordonia sp. 852002-50816_SCH5313054-a]OBC18991.1 Holliday junction DNA helicase RuvA [Gordonia sp. 852002-50816_SCH5313054-c]SKZ45766.1 RNAse H-fold protein YqgF [Mycobacteroides abscessus subsp. abscessus]